MAVLVGILHKCGGASGRMDSGGEKEAVHGLPCTAEGDKGSVHSGALIAQEEHRHRAGAGGPFFALFGAYQRTVRGAAAKELNVAVASVSASTCVLPSSAAYILCSSG